MAELGGRVPRQSALGALLEPRRIGPARAGTVRPSERAADAGDLADRGLARGRRRAALRRSRRAAEPGPARGADVAGSDRATVAFQVAPRRWWLVVQEARRSRFDATLASASGHARGVHRSRATPAPCSVSAGPASRSVLAKLCRIDLHPQAFPPGRVAQTAAWPGCGVDSRDRRAPGFDLYLPRSFARERHREPDRRGDRIRPRSERARPRFTDHRGLTGSRSAAGSIGRRRLRRHSSGDRAPAADHSMPHAGPPVRRTDAE